MVSQRLMTVLEKNETEEKWVEILHSSVKEGLAGRMILEQGSEEGETMRVRASAQGLPQKKQQDFVLSPSLQLLQFLFIFFLILLVIMMTITASSGIR